MSDVWDFQRGRDLAAVPVPPGSWKRIVALLNVWNDVDELGANLPTWHPYVDHVIAVDGAYAGIEGGISDDGTREVLESLGNVTIIDAPGLEQPAKRSLYFEGTGPGDLLWIIDADERVSHSERIRETPDLDVGWVPYTSPIYRRTQAQPRVLRWRPGLKYDGRHHWLYAGERLVASHQLGGLGLVHRLLFMAFHNSRGTKRTPHRRRTSAGHRQEQHRTEAELATPTGSNATGWEPLRICQLGKIDAGGVAYRLHTAINTSTPHASIMGTDDPQWTAAPRQYAWSDDRKTLTAAADSCDVLHLHLNYQPRYSRFLHLPWPRRQPIVIHHHGTLFRRKHEVFAELDRENARLRLVSNLELLQYGERLHWLPNPVPWARYRQMAEGRPRWEHRPFRIAHSPTKRELKGSDVFERVVNRLQAKGLRIEPVLIHGVKLAESLAIKATCHALFDSFWLGLQCSGLEAAAMGLPVIAGDEDVRREYTERFGAVPYTWANDEKALEEAIERLATERDYYRAEAGRVQEYTRSVHDGPAVAQRYLDLLQEAIGWRQKMALGTFRGRMVA